MDSTLSQEDFEASSPTHDSKEPGTPGLLNRACLLSEGEFFLADLSDCSTPNMPPTIIPETPSPLCLRRRRRYIGDFGTASVLSPPPSEPDRFPIKTPSAHQRSKRRKLSVPATSMRGETRPCTSWGTTGFVPASSLIGKDSYLGTWLESPLPTKSTSLSSPPSSSLGAPPASQEVSAEERFSCNTHAQEPVTVSSTVEAGPSSHSRGRKRTSKQAVSTKFSFKSYSTCASTSTNTDSGSEKERLSPGRELPLSNAEQRLHKYEEIVISDDDDVIVQAMVRSVQVEEDEALARSLQEQFDREEQLQQERRRQEAMPPDTPPRSYPYDPYLGMNWMSPWSAAVNYAALSPLVSGLVTGLEEDLRGRRRGRGRSRAPRRRNPRHAIPDLFDDSQGENYEALLAFEEGQGAVVAKNTLSKREIDRLPTKAYDSAHSAGKTQCQICFSDYTDGEQLRMLPCLHDYHVQCIDRWLKENATCPICRADVSV